MLREITPELRARIDADFAAKVGPFARAVLTARPVSEHYDLHCNPATETLDRLAARKVNAGLSLWVMDPAHKSKHPREVRALYASRAPAVQHDEAALELLNRPRSYFQLHGGSAETEALVLGDFHARTGPFVRPVLVAAELVDFYGEHHFRTALLAGNLLAGVSYRVQTAIVSGKGTRLYVVHDDPALMAMKPRDLLNAQRRGVGLPETHGR